MRKGVKLQAAILAALAGPTYAGDICLPSDASIKSLPLVLQCFEGKLKSQQKQIASLTKENQSFKQKTDALTVSSDGNVGIGTTSPKAKLHTHGGKIRVSESDGVGQSGVVELSNGTKTNYIFTAADGHLYARTDSAKHHVLLQAGSTSGNVGIGTTSPGAKLEVVGTVNLNGKNLSGSGLTCTDVEGSKSGRADDAPSYASCSSGYTLTGCTCYSPWNSCDGAKPDRAKNRCIAFNMSGGAGVYAEATCCKVH
jgi:hypothetical protein